MYHKSTEHDDSSSHNNISPGRLEAFSDGVVAIIITIMVLELKIPHGDELIYLKPLIPVFIAYVVSFQTVGTFWNNHHHLLKLTNHISAGIMWANLHLLFWLSLIPFGTSWLEKTMAEKFQLRYIQPFCLCAPSPIFSCRIQYLGTRKKDTSL